MKLQLLADDPCEDPLLLADEAHGKQPVIIIMPY